MRCLHLHVDCCFLEVCMLFGKLPTFPTFSIEIAYRCSFHALLFYLYWHSTVKKKTFSIEIALCASAAVKLFSSYRFFHNWNLKKLLDTLVHAIPCYCEKYLPCCVPEHKIESRNEENERRNRLRVFSFVSSSTSSSSSCLLRLPQY